MRCYQRRHYAGTLKELPPRRRGRGTIERTEKHCPRCKTTKPISAFSVARDRADGHMGWCKSCYSDQRRAKGGHWREYELQRNYGIGVAEYNALLHKQGGACAICKSTPKGALAVDHCHDSGAVRGLLCTSCNNGLGRFRDDPDRLLSAATYLIQQADLLSSRSSCGGQR